MRPVSRRPPSTSSSTMQRSQSMEREVDASTAERQCYDATSPVFSTFERSSLITSSMLRIDSPLITFCTSSASSVSCSTSAFASYWRRRNRGVGQAPHGWEKGGNIRACVAEGYANVRTRWSSSALDLSSAVTRDSPAISRLSRHKGRGT